MCVCARARVCIMHTHTHTHTGHVTREDADSPAAPAHRAVGADGRPMTSAGSFGAGGAVAVGVGAERRGGRALGMGGSGEGAGRDEECVCGQELVLRFESNWGDPHAIGLCGLVCVCNVLCMYPYTYMYMYTYVFVCIAYGGTRMPLVFADWYAFVKCCVCVCVCMRL